MHVSIKLAKYFINSVIGIPTTVASWQQPEFGFFGGNTALVAGLV
jgi:hypothetical protein